MPAYAKDGKVVCFFRSAQKFKERTLQVLIAQLVGHEKGLITGDVYFDPDIRPLSHLIEFVMLPDTVRSQIAWFSFN